MWKGMIGLGLVVGKERIMRGKHVALIALLSVVLFPGLCFGERRATGALWPTAEELSEMKKHWPRIREVLPNEIGLARINTKRRALGLPELDAGAASPIGADTVAFLDDGEMEPTAGAELLPDSVDNSLLPSFPPIGDQTYADVHFASCVSFAVIYYQLTHTTGMARGWDASNENNRFSPKWTYNFLNQGEYTNGTGFMDTYDIARAHGAATWADFPYDSDYRGWAIDKNTWRNALDYRIAEVQQIPWNPNTDAFIQQIKELLNNGYTIVFLTGIYGWEYTTISDDPSISEDDAFVGEEVGFWLSSLEGGHGMNFAGYNDNLWTDINGNGTIDVGEKGAFKVANSHGTEYGNDGFIWLAYDAMKSVSDIPGAPSEGRYRATAGSLYHMILRDDYTPDLVAEVTLSHKVRSEMTLHLGINEAGRSRPSSLWSATAINKRMGLCTSLPWVPYVVGH